MYCSEIDDAKQLLFEYTRFRTLGEKLEENNLTKLMWKSKENWDSKHIYVIRIIRAK